VRIIAGDLRGRRLKSPRGESTRPTSDRVREALFDILAPRISGAVFLDAYAGTGAVGIEALSRGAERVVFVESEAAVARLLSENLGAFGLLPRSRLEEAPFARVARRLATDGPFDLVFLDPPYGPGEILRALRLCDVAGLLDEDGTLIAEHDAKLALPEREGSLLRSRANRYGGTMLTMFRRG